MYQVSSGMQLSHWVTDHDKIKLLIIAVYYIQLFKIKSSLWLQQKKRTTDQFGASGRMKRWSCFAKLFLFLSVDAFLADKSRRERKEKNKHMCQVSLIFFSGLSPEERKSEREKEREGLADSNERK